MHIRPLQAADLMMLARHELRHSRENGRDGDFIFALQEEERAIKEEDFPKQMESLLKPVTEIGWRRFWILTDEKEVFGEITLIHHPPLQTSLHRCLLAMGMERSVRGRGWGSKLMEEALGWARAQPSLDWVSLCVFENNIPAKALYKKFGFQLVGTSRDLFRVFGQSIDDSEMVLKLR